MRVSEDSPLPNAVVHTRRSHEAGWSNEKKFYHAGTECQSKIQPRPGSQASTSCRGQGRQVDYNQTESVGAKMRLQQEQLVSFSS